MVLAAERATSRLPAPLHEAEWSLGRLCEDRMKGKIK
jgi:hypothetical protein